MAASLRIARPRRSTLTVVSDKFFNVRTGILLIVSLYCCFKAIELGDQRTEVSKLLSKIGLQKYEQQFATKGYFSVDDVLLVSTSELMQDIGFESRIMASQVKEGAQRWSRGDFLGRSLFYVVLVVVGFSAAMCILSQNFRKAAAEICILLLLLGWSFGRRQYRQFYSVEELAPQAEGGESETGVGANRDRDRKRKKIEKVKNYFFSCCFPKKSEQGGETVEEVN